MNLDKQQTTTSTSEQFVPGILSDMTHVVNSKSSGKIYVNSQLQSSQYILDTSSELNQIVNQQPEQLHNGHLGIVVFVSDYNNVGLQKLQENKVWLQVFDRLETWVTETSDYYVMLVNEFGTPGNIVGLLAAAQNNPNINTIGITFVAHGAVSKYGHGILLHHDYDPKVLGIMDGNIFRQALEPYGLTSIPKLIHTNLHSCYLIDEYQQFRSDSVLGFFEDLHPNQILTGYKGVTYLNTKFVLSLENLLAAGTYVLPTTVTKVDKEVTGSAQVFVQMDQSLDQSFNNNYKDIKKNLGRVTEVTTEKYSLEMLDKDVAQQYQDNFKGDETLFVSNINNSPAPDGGSSFDSRLFDHLGIIPSSGSGFPIAGDLYSFEGHKSGSWSEFFASNDDNSFYFADRTDLHSFQDEFSGPTLDITTKWDTLGTVSLSDGYAIMQNYGAKIIEKISHATGRGDYMSYNFVFEFTETSGNIIFGIESTSNYLNNFKFVYDPSLNKLWYYVDENPTLIQSGLDLVGGSNYSGFTYSVTITIDGTNGTISLTSFDDPSLNIVQQVTINPISNPRVRIESDGPTIYADMVQVNTINGMTDSYQDTGSQLPTLVDYNFEDNVIDQSGNGLDGTWQSTPSYSGPDYQRNGYFSSNGVQIANSLTFTGTDDFSVSAWVKTTSASDMLVFSQQKCSSGVIQMNINQGIPKFRVGNTNDIVAWAIGPNTINDGTWHLLTGVRLAGDSIKLYVDGILEASTPYTLTNAPITNNPSENWVGRKYVCGSYAYFQGNIDSFRIYSEALTLENITNIKQEYDHVIEYPFNHPELSGVINAQNGIDAVNYGAEYVATKDDYAMYFDQSSGTGVQIPQDSSMYFSGTDSFTVSAWVKTTSASDMLVFSQQRCSSGVIQLNINQGIPKFRVGNTNNVVVWAIGTDTINDGNWHQMTGVRNATDSIKLFVDGNLVATTPFTLTNAPITAGTTENWIGRRYTCGGENEFLGSIDDFSVYRYALSDAEAHNAAVTSIGSQLYPTGAYEGAVTEGAFALKFTKDTYTKSFSSHNLNLLYGTQSGIEGLIKDYIRWQTCGYMNDWDDATCLPSGSITITRTNIFGLTATYGTFEHALWYYRGYDIYNEGVNWEDRWFEQVLDAALTIYGSEFNNPFDGMFQYDTTVYYNMALTSLNVDMEIKGQGISNGDFKLYYVTDYGTTISSYTTLGTHTINVDPTANEHNFFYLQVKHGVNANNIQISFSIPTGDTYTEAWNEFTTGTWNYFYFHQRTVTSDIQLVDFTRNSDQIDFTYSDLPTDISGGMTHYYINKMVAIGGLGTSDFGNAAPVKVEDYGVQSLGGSHTTLDQTFYPTSVSSGSYTYEMYQNDGDTTDYFGNILNWSGDQAFMYSFALTSRTNQNVAISIVEPIPGYSASSPSKTIMYDAYGNILESVEGQDSNEHWSSYNIKVGPNPVILNLKTQRHSGELSTYKFKVDFTSIPTGVDIGFFELNSDGQPVYLKRPWTEVFDPYNGSQTHGHLKEIVGGRKFKTDWNYEIDTAAIHWDAQASMQSAANTNPTKDKVFDIDQMFQSLISSFEDFKDSIKSKIYQYISIKAVAGFVWDLVKKYGFGSIERVISWFNDNEQRKQDLGELITADGGDLGYGSTNFDNVGSYVKLAKVAILYFAQYVQTNYIDGTTLGNLWGGSLVDVVNYISQIGSYVVNVGTTTITRVKNGLNGAWNGIKAGAEYLANAVLTPILQSFQYLLIKLIETILIITTKLTSITYNSITNGFNVANGGNTISFEVKITSHYSIELVINGNSILDISTPYLAPIANFETLTVDESGIQKAALDVGLVMDGVTIVNYFLAFIPAIDKSVVIETALKSFVALYYLELGTYAYYIVNGGEDSAKYFAKTMEGIHIVSASATNLGSYFGGLTKGIQASLKLASVIGGIDLLNLANLYSNPISRPILGMLGICGVGLLARLLSGDMTALKSAKNIATLSTFFVIYHLLMLVIFLLLD